MRRGIHHALTLFLYLLVQAMLALWFFSHCRADGVMLWKGVESGGATARDGVVRIWWGPFTSVSFLVTDWSGFGVAYRHWQANSQHAYSIEIRCLLLVIFSAVALVVWICPFRRGAMPKRRCVVCGYDLRATPERCPKCGTVAAEVRS